jgi:hypothetical protein
MPNTTAPEPAYQYLFSNPKISTVELAETATRASELCGHLKKSQK